MVCENSQVAISHDHETVLQTFLLSTIGSHGTKHKQVMLAELHHFVLRSLQHRQETKMDILSCILQCYISWATFLQGVTTKLFTLYYYLLALVPALCAGPSQQNNNLIIYPLCRAYAMHVTFTVGKLV